MQGIFLDRAGAARCRIEDYRKKRSLFSFITSVWLVFRSWGLAILLEPPDRGRDLFIGRCQASGIPSSALSAIIIACFSLENVLQQLEFAMIPCCQVGSGDVKGLRERL